MRKKFIAYLLTGAMLVGLFVIGAGASADVDQAEPIILPEEVASIMATYFIRDAQTMPDSKWTEDTFIANTETMYGSDGTVSAYSFELETAGEDAGYVVVSAYPDVESKILEFSDTAEPVYKELDLQINDTIVYTGGLNYFKEVDSKELLSVDGDVINRADVLAPLEDSRDVAYSVAPPVTAYGGSPIENPLAWANSAYGGTFTAKEWKNAFENHCRFRTMSQFSYVNGISYKEHCGPTAITNLLEIVARYRGYDGVPYDTITQAFYQVAKLGMDKGYFVNNSMTYFNLSEAYLKESFALFSITTSVSRKNINYSNVKTAIDGYNPLFIALDGHNIYGNHFVAGYAYTCFENQQGDRVPFIKIADGWNGSGRYLPIDDNTVNTSPNGFESMDVISILSLG